MFRVLMFGLSMVVVSVFAGVPGGQPLVVGAAPVLTADCAVNPPPLVPVSPANLDTVTTTSPTLRVDAPVLYNLYHFRVLEGASIAAEGYSFLPTWRVAVGGRVLQRGHSYQWSCRAWASGGWGPWFAPTWQFTVGSLVKPPSPKLPRDGDTLHVRRPLFVVSLASGSARYHFQVFDGKTLVGEGVSSLPFWLFEGGGGGLEPGNLYTWTCRIEESADTSDWFDPVRSFEVGEVQTTAEGSVGVPSEVGIRAVPNPFTSKTAISLQLAVGSRADARIYDGTGRLVRMFRQLPIVTRHSSIVSWDGRDESGRMLGPGTYICRVWVSDAREQVLKIEKLR
jgi:hypothetical protein